MFYNTKLILRWVIVFLTLTHFSAVLALSSVNPVAGQLHSAYLEPINIPAYNAADATHLLITVANGQLSSENFNNTHYNHFYIEPGDYNQANIILNSSGTKTNRRTISLLGNIGKHPASLALTDQVNIKFTFQQANYWILDRLSTLDFSEYDNGYNVMQFFSSSNNIISNCYLNNNYGGILIRDGSNNNTIQNCRISNMSLSGLKGDRVAIALSGVNSIPRPDFVEVKNTKIINNEIVNCNDGFQAVRHNNSVKEFYDANYEGTIIDSNIIYITPTLYTDGSGNFDVNGKYAYAENAIDLKAGSDNVHNKMIITHNYMWGFRRSDKTNSGLNDWGTAISIHFGVKNLIFKNNYMFDSARGLAVAAKDRFKFALSDSEISNNTFVNIGVLSGELGIEFFSHLYEVNNVKFTDNSFVNKEKDKEKAVWLSVLNISNTLVSCNTIVNTSPDRGDFSDTTNTSSNNRFYNVNTIMDGTNNKSLSEVQLASFSFLINAHTNTPEVMTVNNAIPKYIKPWACTANISNMLFLLL